MARKYKPDLEFDAHLIDRARLTASDFESINAPIKAAIKQQRETEAELVSLRAWAKEYTGQQGRTATARPLAEGEGAGASAPPPSNTGGKSESVELVLENGEVKQLLKRVHARDTVCFLDWVNVTVHETSFGFGEEVTDEQVILDCSEVCYSIFGFGITSKRDKGLNFYRDAYVLGDGYGHVCIGGQRNTVLISLSGEGCAAARSGWEFRLHKFLSGAQQPRITRIDLAHDDYEGQYFTAEKLEEAYDLGAFNCGGRNPDVELRGNWKNPNGKGRTIYVGQRGNGKFFRGYEKGCQLGAPDSKWFRLEIEFGSRDRIIPLDILLKPSEYFAGAYPYFNNFNGTCTRILTVQKTVEHSYEKMKSWLRHQCGAALNLMYEIEGDASAVLGLVIREGKFPRGLVPPSWTYPVEYLHYEKIVLTPAILHNFERE